MTCAGGDRQKSQPRSSLSLSSCTPPPPTSISLLLLSVRLCLSVVRRRGPFRCWFVPFLLLILIIALYRQPQPAAVASIVVVRPSRAGRTDGRTLNHISSQHPSPLISSPLHSSPLFSSPPSSFARLILKPSVFFGRGRILRLKCSTTTTGEISRAGSDILARPGPLIELLLLRGFGKNSQVAVCVVMRVVCVYVLEC